MHQLTPAPAGRKGRAILLLVLASPTVCFASDMTGAAVFVAFWGLVLCLILGTVAAAVLKFAFRRSHHVWWLVPGVPAAAIALVAAYSYTQRDRVLHSGPAIHFLGSHSVTVSNQFGQKELDRACEKLGSAPFAAAFRAYALDPMPIFELNLTIQADADARRFVSISTSPHFPVRSRTYNAVMFLFSKAVIESDPAPADTPYSSPPDKLAERD